MKIPVQSRQCYDISGCDSASRSKGLPGLCSQGEGYSLMNVFDPKVAGGIAMAAFPEGEPEPILLSSEESTGSSHGLTHRSSRAGPQQRPGPDPTVGDVSTPPVIDPTIAANGTRRN
ncbi:hypothetical protein Hanom_Chr16g01458631 [Helianthus anomalus]